MVVEGSYSSRHTLRVMLPLLLFHAARWLMLICYSLAVAEFMSGHLGLLASLYVVSSSAFSGAFASGLALRRKIGYPLLPGPRSARRTVVVLFLSLGGSMLVLWNAYMYGPPLLLRLFGATMEGLYGIWPPEGGAICAHDTAGGDGRIGASAMA
jgi:hypothetical protein